MLGVQRLSSPLLKLICPDGIQRGRPLAPTTCSRPCRPHGGRRAVLGQEPAPRRVRICCRSCRYTPPPPGWRWECCGRSHSAATCALIAVELQCDHQAARALTRVPVLVTTAQLRPPLTGELGLQVRAPPRRPRCWVDQLTAARQQGASGDIGGLCRAEGTVDLVVRLLPKSGFVAAPPGGA